MLLRSLVLCGLLVRSVAAQGAWVEHGAMNLARQETGAARIGDTVYVVGGLLDEFTFVATPTVEALDLVTQTWSFVSPMPVGLDHAAVAAVGRKLYVMGGYSGNFQSRAEVYAYDPAMDAWSQRAPLPEARGGAWAVAFEGRIYLFGGKDPASAPRATTYVYDPTLDQWSRLADMPTAREHTNAARVGDFLYVVGGRNQGGSVAANERYDPATDTWVSLAPMSAARSAMGLVGFAGKLYAAGGEVPMLFDLHEVYDPSTDAWTTLPPMPIPRHGIASIALDDRILYPGGALIQDLQPTAAVDAFVFGPGVGFCFGSSGCPCGNDDYGAAGCVNSTGSGATLTGSGSTSVASDDLVLTASGFPAGNSGLFFMGADVARPIDVGDGLACTGGLFRFFPSTVSAAGTLSLSRPVAGARPGMIAAGDTRHFQAWARDVLCGPLPGPCSSPCGTGSNLSSGYSVTFEP